MPARNPSVRARAPRGEKRVCLADGALRIGNRFVPLLSGAMHYFRIAPDAWKPALHELRNMGFPLVETYVPWSVHEIGPGEYDFGARDPQKDLGRFLDLAEEEKLFVFLRPGPHINAEMTHFGIPERVIYDKTVQARSPRQNPVVLPFPPQMFPVPSYASTRYHAEVGKWFDAVGAVVAPRIWPNGPVVLLQVDNEAGYFFRNGPYDQDYHPDAIALWREFLALRYGTTDDCGRAHGLVYGTWDEVQPPERFAADRPEALAIHLDWAAFQEWLIETSLSKMRKRMEQAALTNVPIVHNLPMGEGGLPLSVPALERAVDLVGLDYYYGAREHRTIKRRTLYLAGTVDLPYAPEMGAGAPPWFTPLSQDDSLFCAMAACAWGVRGFNLYMTVDRDRWYGAPIDARGNPRVDAALWKHFLQKLAEERFHEMRREAEVALVVPSEYARLSRATHVFGPLSPSTLEAFGGTPVSGCREDTLGFKGPIQVLWWQMLAKMSDALTRASIPYVYVDSNADESRLAGKRVVVAPTYEICAQSRWKLLQKLAKKGICVVHGPATPVYDERLARFCPAAITGGDSRQVLLDTPEDADTLVDELLRAHNLARPYPATPGVETALHEHPNGRKVLFVISPSRRPIETSIALSGPTELVDLLNGERFEGSDHVVIPMPARAVRIFGLRAREAPPKARATAPRPRAKRGKAS